MNGGDLDTSQEHKYTVAPGMEHKYKDTALLLVSKGLRKLLQNSVSGKRLFSTENKEVVNDVTLGVEYIRKHKGNHEHTSHRWGLSNTIYRKTGEYCSTVEEIDHVGIIRFGSKMVAFNPYRIINDPDLPDMVKIQHPKEKGYI